MSTADPLDAYDLSDILYEEAHMLRDRALSSARTVMGVIAMITLLVSMLGLYFDAAIWLFCSTTMVGITILYARWIWADGIARDQVQAYLRGHVIVTAGTGLLWGGFAIHIADPGSELRTFVAGIFLTSITTGGAINGTVYRPGYLALAFCSLLPFAMYLLLFGESISQVFGVFMLFYFGFCYITNEQASRRTREAIVGQLGRAAAQKILEQSREIERLYAEKSRLIETISHDMTQPLLAQRHLLRALAHGITDPGQSLLVQQLDSTQRSQQRLLKDLAMFREGASAPEGPATDRVDLEALFAQLRGEFEPQFADRRMPFVAEAELGAVASDGHLIGRILRNFLSNALKYAGEGAEVSLRAQQEAGAARLSVTDRGAGFDMAAHPDLFDDYVRLPNAGAEPGQGLGLSITRQLAADLGGTVDLRSAPGAGTTAVLTLPLGTAEALAGPESKFAMVVGSDLSPGQGGWANLVSDWMWEFAHAETPEAALDLIETLDLVPDVIVFDPQPAPHPAVLDLQDLAPCLSIQREDGAALAGTHVLRTPFHPDTLRDTVFALATGTDSAP